MESGRYYFDWQNYRTMLRLIRREPDRAQRRSRYLTMLVIVPIFSTINAICFALDPILFPSLRRTKVEKPVFLVGHARSGTTFLHRQLAEDPQFSYVLFWEMFFPSVLQKRILRRLLWLDKRVFRSALHRRILAAEEARVGDHRGMHDTGFFVPEEDDFMLTMSCASGFWILLFAYMRELDVYNVDTFPEKRRRRIMAFYKECVRRQIHLNGGDRIHLSKNPTFCGRVESLIETFPDARFVVQVRNPYETIPSLLKLLQVSWRGGNRDEELIRDSLRVLAEQSFHSYEYPLQVLEARGDVPSTIVEYRDLVADPGATLRKVYDELSLGARPVAMGKRRSDPGREHISTHEYSLDEFGLEADEIHRRLAPLFDRFGWDDTKETTHA